LAIGGDLTYDVLRFSCFLPQSWKKGETEKKEAEDLGDRPFVAVFPAIGEGGEGGRERGESTCFTLSCQPG